MPYCDQQAVQWGVICYVVRSDGVGISRVGVGDEEGGTV